MPKKVKKILQQRLNITKEVKKTTFVIVACYY